eukprot:CFRG6182T1
MPVPTGEEIFESLTSAVFVFSGARKVVQCNGSFLAYSGYSREEILSISVDELLDLKAANSYRLTAWPEGTPARLNRKDGSTKPVSLSVGRIQRKETMSTTAYYSVIVTDFKETIEGESRTFIDAVFSSAQDGIIAIEETGLILAFNHAAEKLFGWTSDDVVGRNVSCLMAKHIALKHQGFIERHLLSGERAAGRAVGRNRQLRGLKRDGSLFPMSLSLSEVNDSSLERRQFVGLIHDQTILEEQRYVAEEANRLNEIMMLTSANGLLTVDEKYRIIAANPSAESIIGRSIDELKGTLLQDVFLPAQRNNITRCLSSGRPMQNINGTMLSTRTEISMNISGFEGKVTPVVCLEDKTKEMKLTKELNQQGELITTMSEISFNGIAEIDSDGQFVAMNATLEKMVGCSAGGLIGKRIDEVLVLDPVRFDQCLSDGTSYMSGLCRYLKGGIGHMMDSGLGGLFRMQWRKYKRATASTNKSGCPGMLNLAKLTSHGWENRFIAEFMDASETQSLQESREKYLANANLTTAIFESAVDAMLVMNTHGKITMFNAAAERMFRMRASDIVDRDISILMPEDIGRIHQQYVDRYLHSGEYAKGRAVGKSRKLMGKRKDGTLFAMSLTVSEIASIDRERTFVGFIRDLTDFEKMQEELEKKTQRILDIFDSSYDGMVVVDIDGVIQSCNVTACRMFGYSRQEALALNVNFFLKGSLTTTPEWERVRRSTSRIQGLAIKQGMQCDGITKDGKSIPLSVIVKEISTRHGRDTLDSDSDNDATRMDRTFTVLFRDLHAMVTTQVKLEEERKGSNDKTMIMNAIFSCATDAIILIEQAGTIIAFNKGAERLFGWSAEEMIDEKVEKLMPLDIAKHHQGYIDKFISSGQQATSRAVGRNRKLEGRRKDGTLFAMTLTLNEVDDNGSSTRRFVGIIRDISDIEKLNEQLLNRNKRIEAIYNSTFDAMLTFELAGTIVHYNKAAIAAFGWSHEEIVGQTIEVMFPPESLKSLMEIPNQIVGGQSGLSSEKMEGGYSRSLVAKRKGGEQFPVHVTVSPVPFVPERPGEKINIKKRQFTVTVRDLSDLHAIASQLDSERLSHGKMRMAGQMMMNALAAISNEDRTVGEVLEQPTQPADVSLQLESSQKNSQTDMKTNESLSKSASQSTVTQTKENVAVNDPASGGISERMAESKCPIIRARVGSPKCKRDLSPTSSVRDTQIKRSRAGFSNAKAPESTEAHHDVRMNGHANKTSDIQTHEAVSKEVKDRVQPRDGARKLDLTLLPDVAILRIAVRLPQYTLLQFAATNKRLREVVSRLPLDWVMKPIRGGRRVKAIINCLPRLHSIKLTPDTVEWETLHDMCELKELKKLDVSYCYITPATVCLIKGLTSLVSLDLSNSDLGSNATSYLTSLTSLTALNLTRCGVKDDDVQFVKSTTNLKDLCLAGCPVTGVGLDAMSKSLTSLVKLDISDTGVEMKSTYGLARITTLTSLNLAGVSSEDSSESLVHLEKLQKLQSLNLDYHHALSDANAENMLALTELTSLSMTDCAVSENSLISFFSQVKLKRLVVSVEGIQPWLTDGAIRAIREQVNLRTFVAAGQELISDVGVIELVSSCPHLRNLDLSYTSVGDMGIKALRNLKNLRILEIYGLNVSREVIQLLKEANTQCQLSE